MRSLILILITFLLSCQSNQSSTNKKEFITVESDNINISSDSIQFQDGDIIFHTSLSNQSQAIQITTDSKYSHMGLIQHKDDEMYVLEAVQPVKYTQFNDWIKRGKDGKYVVKRHIDSQSFLDNAGIQKMKKIGKQYLGKDYDLQFLWSDDRIYCSELVWKIYDEAFDIQLGQLQTFKDFDFSDPTVAKKVKERFKDISVFNNESVITPSRVFEADGLVTIFQN